MDLSGELPLSGLLFLPHKRIEIVKRIVNRTAGAFIQDRF
jgi:hypothetical protein